MKLLLRRDIPNVGLAGDVVEVREGYARNYLLPQHMAVLPTNANMKAIEEDKRRAEEERRQKRTALEAQAKELVEKEVTISAACNEEGHLYGSVGPREIAAALRNDGHEVQPKQVHLFEPIRRLDSVTVPVVFAEDLNVDVKVWVVRERAADEIEEEETSSTEPQPEQTEQTEQRREARRYGYGGGIDALETEL
jgi:large subunit ribosomal protein L9